VNHHSVAASYSSLFTAKVEKITRQETSKEGENLTKNIRIYY